MAIRAKTNKIPDNPATQEAVQAIPINPVLATDPRLSRLDVNVSTRATPADFAGYATTLDVVHPYTSVNHMNKVTRTNKIEIPVQMLRARNQTLGIMVILDPIAPSRFMDDM